MIVLGKAKHLIRNQGGVTANSHAFSSTVACDCGMPQSHRNRRYLQVVQIQKATSYLKKIKTLEDNNHTDTRY
jgi:hypothetical protein